MPKLIVRSALMLIVLGVFAPTVSAQIVELYPNAGGFWPGKTDHGDMKNGGTFGLKGGVFLDQNVELEGGFGYINHFEMKSPPSALNGTTFGFGSPAIHGFLYDVNGSWNFGQRQFFNTRISPYLTIGAGGLTAEIKDAASTYIRSDGVKFADGTLVPSGRSILLNDGDMFLTVNYGGGIKAMNLWGPMGLRADIKGRTLPNFFGQTPELTGGLTFTWGER